MRADTDSPKKFRGRRACPTCAGTGRVWDEMPEEIAAFYEPIEGATSVETVFRCPACRGTGRSHVGMSGRCRDVATRQDADSLSATTR